jgi:predicted Zn-dependent protease
VDPHDAGAEYVLGEIGRQEQDWSGAIEHFTRAVKFDPTFADAMIELGRTLISADRPAEAVPYLEKAVQLQPDNPSAHYQLATAYRRVGRTEDAQKETAAFQETSTKARQNLQQIRSAVTGRQTPAQADRPPQ